MKGPLDVHTLVFAKVVYNVKVILENRKVKRVKFQFELLRFSHEQDGREKLFLLFFGHDFQ